MSLWKKTRLLEGTAQDGRETPPPSSPVRHLTRNSLLVRKRTLFQREVEATAGFLTTHFALLGLFSQRGQEGAFQSLFQDHLYACILVHDSGMLALWQAKRCSFKLLFSTAQQGNCLVFLAQVQVASDQLRRIPAHWWYTDIASGRVSIAEAREGASSYIIYERER